jgi:hypothetical protein
MENLNPLDVLKEELDTDDVAQKINAVHRLRIVGTIMGAEGIRNVLLPYIDSNATKLYSPHQEGVGRSAFCHR